MVPLSILAMVLSSGDRAGLLGQASPEQRALLYLAREVPRWPVRHRCYSCHNNGDAARALYSALRQGYAVPPAALADTTRWLTRPAGWDHNGGDVPHKDERLATLHFAAALVGAYDEGLVKDGKPLAAAAARVASYQARDGSWPVVAEGGLGSPTTHGVALATYLGRRVLRKADARKYARNLGKADTWMRRVPVKTVLDAAALLMALGQDADDCAAAQRCNCMVLVRKGESKEGGWGPYVHSPPEVFDTAIVLLALASQPATVEVQALRRKGRAFLVAEQHKDGSWQETTRPSGAVSYAQRISTSAWAMQALLATPARTDRGPWTTHRDYPWKVLTPIRFERRPRPGERPD